MTKCHKQESFGILHFENSNLFRISIFEFRISRLGTLFGSGFAGLGGYMTNQSPPLFSQAKIEIIQIDDAGER